MTKTIEDQLRAYGEAVEQMASGQPEVEPDGIAPQVGVRRLHLAAAAGVVVALLGIGAMALRGGDPGTDLAVDAGNPAAPPSGAVDVASEYSWTHHTDGPLADVPAILPPVAVTGDDQRAYVVRAGDLVAMDADGTVAPAGIGAPPGMQVITAAVTVDGDLYVSGYSEAEGAQFQTWAGDGWMTMPPPGPEPAFADDLLAVGDEVGYVTVAPGTGLLGLAFLDVDTRTWSHSGPSPIKPRDAAGVAVVGDRVVIWGGCAPKGQQCDDVADEQVRPHYPAPALGADEAVSLDDGAIYDRSTDRWVSTPPSPLAPGFAITADATGDDVVHLFVGRSSAGHPQAATLDSDSGRWMMLPDPPLTPRVYATSAVLDGDWVVFGGGLATASSDGAVFDLAGGGWRLLPSAASARERHSMVSVGGTVYVVGGWASEGWLELHRR